MVVDRDEEERGGRRYKQSLRDSDIPEEPPSGVGRWIGGCAIAVVGLTLLIGAVGLVVGGSERLARFSEAGEGRRAGGEQEPSGEGGGEGEGSEEGGQGGEASAGREPPAPAGPTHEQAVEEMRRRYLPGPYVELANLVPSGRLFASALGSMQGSIPAGASVGGRTVRTPWVVAGARLLPDPAPGPSGAGGPTIANGPDERPAEAVTVIPGTPIAMGVRSQDAQGGSAVRRYLIAFDGYPGHFEIDATVPTELGWVQAGGSEEATLHLSIRTPARPDGSLAAAGQPFEVLARIAAVDRQGRISTYLSRRLMVQPVATGDVEVTLTMGEATDMDLYVDGPSGETIYYGNRRSSGGGQLDLDANAACSSNMGVNNEHIFWPRGQAPAGWYRVRVAHYESCIAGRPVSFRLTVSSCGETAILTGGFDGRASSQSCTRLPTESDRWWCQDVVRFYVPRCQDAAPAAGGSPSTI